MITISKAMAGVTAFLLVGSSLAATKVEVKEGTDVKLRFAQTMHSKTAKVGDTVKFTVDEDLVIDGNTILKKGTSVMGKIEKVKKRERFGQNAEIRLSINNVKTPWGKGLPLRPKNKGQRVDSQTGGAAAASVGGAALLGPIGLVGGYFVMGKTVNAKVGDKLTAEVSKDTTVNVR